jgi:hypothetical protein
VKVNIDFSVFSSPVSAYGNVTGILELPSLPTSGDTVSFSFSKNAALLPDVGFSGLITVENVIFESGGGNPSLSLASIIVKGEEKAEALMKYFENGFGFFGIRYQQN